MAVDAPNPNQFPAGRQITLMLIALLRLRHRGFFWRCRAVLPILRQYYEWRCYLVFFIGVSPVLFRCSADWALSGGSKTCLDEPN